MKILTWETAKNEGAMEAIKKIEKALKDSQAVWYSVEEAKDFVDYIKALKKQYK